MPAWPGEKLFPQASLRFHPAGTWKGPKRPCTMRAFTQAVRVARSKGCADALKDATSTITALKTMATKFKAAGKVDEGLLLFREVLACKQELHGPNHPTSINAMVQLANVLQELPEQTAEVGDQAESLMRMAAKRTEATLGGAHHESLQAISSLVALLTVRSKLLEAEPLARDVEARCRDLLGPAHPATVVARSNLAQVFAAQGKLFQAEPLMRTDLRVSRATLGEYHPDTVASYSNLAFCLTRQGRHGEAVPLLRSELAGARRMYGKAGKERTLRCLRELVLALTVEGEAEAAALYAYDELALSREHLGREHEDTSRAGTELATLLVTLGKVTVGDGR